MRKNWLGIVALGLVLSGCSTETEQVRPTPAPTVYHGPVEEISGAEPRYEPFNPSTMQDYTVNGRSYKIVKNPENFSQTGLATWYGEELSGNRTSLGEEFDPNALAAAHPTLPIPSYVRVTNLSNGRQLVVRVNDRGPFTPGRIIDLTRAAGERLNISNNTRVKVDFISVAPDGTLSGPGTVGTRVAKQSFALPERPNLSAGGMSAPVMTSAIDSHTPPTAPDTASDNASSTVSPTTNAAPSGGFLGAPQPLRSGVLETPQSMASVSASPAVATTPAAASGNVVVQVGALKDSQRADAWLSSLKSRFNVQGNVTQNNGLYRVQLGPFTSRQQAVELQQRLANEAQQQSFITTL
ncbi:endolytic peptidoglycan transglycosylase RlpA [Lonsdalea britannica]|uniref:endolytic peptidoglycan transglycosylase RlpA n=1 Tax=Lonsdalea britannica TaxID=1082704 RepID=UPI0026F1EB24|nr:endolytic peptidoglycan transglycosylase RlpA [Lonsdalea britannica]